MGKAGDQISPLFHKTQFIPLLVATLSLCESAYYPIIFAVKVPTIAVHHY